MASKNRKATRDIISQLEDDSIVAIPLDEVGERLKENYDIEKPDFEIIVNQFQANGWFLIGAPNTATVGALLVDRDDLFETG